MSNIDTLVEDSLRIIAMKEAALGASEPPERVLPIPGSLYTAKDSGRRGEVLWTFSDTVCIAFNSGFGRKEHALSDFLRLYTEVC